MLWLGGAAPPKAQDAHAPGATSASRQCSPAASHSPQPPGTDRSFASLVPRLTSSQIDELIRNALQRQRHQEANGVGRHQAGHNGNSVPESRGGQPARDRREVCGGAQVNARGQKDHKEAAGLANKVGKEIFPEEHFREIRGSHREINTRKYTTGRSERSGWANMLREDVHAAQLVASPIISSVLPAFGSG